jgi:hypothetical protein
MSAKCGQAFNRRGLRKGRTHERRLAGDGADASARHAIEMALEGPILGKKFHRCQKVLWGGFQWLEFTHPAHLCVRFELTYQPQEPHGSTLPSPGHAALRGLRMAPFSRIPMAGKLTFDLAALKPLAEHAFRSTNFTVGFEMLYDPKNHKGGVIVMKDGMPDPDNIDPARLKPAFQLVKDHGVYLMSNGLPPLPKGSNVVYANEVNPEKMPFDDWWDAGNSIMGGDDCVITLDLPRIVLDGLAGGAELLAVTVTARDVQCVALKRRKGELSRVA